jgi:lysozyme
MTFSSLAARMMEIVRNTNVGKKPDTVKRMNEQINEALAQAPVIPDPLPPVTHRKTSKTGIDLMHKFEGLHKVRSDGRVEAYPDPGTGGDPWTIGWGSTGNDPFNGGKIRKGTVWTREQCDLHFTNHLATFEAAVRDHLGNTPTSQPQFDAMVCLTYNIGPSAFGRSTVLRRHKAGDFDGAAKAFLMWNKAGGRVMRGLTRRREEEAALYRSGS